MNNNISRTDAFLLRNCDKFHGDQILAVRSAINSLPEERQVQAELVSLRSPQLVMVMAWFFGMFGVDRFMNGQIGLGILKIITLGGVGFWLLIDIFTAYKRTQIRNCKAVIKATAKA